MMKFLLPLIAFSVSLITFYSGFGLGTLLMPAIALFFPVTFAIALTAVIHFLNNCFKFTLLWRDVHWRTVGLFGIPALCASFVGAWLLVSVSISPLHYAYNLFGMTATVTLVKVIVGILLLLFSAVDAFPVLKKTFLFNRSLPVGGILSGFFGGLSGHQGAFRSAYLLHIPLNKNQFIATNAAIAMLVDSVRLSIYGISMRPLFESVQMMFIVLVALASFAGTLIAKYFLKQVTIKFIHVFVSIMLFVFGIALVIGLL